MADNKPRFTVQRNVRELKIPTMLTIQEAAAKTGLATHHLRQLVWQNKIVYIKAGNKYLINLERLIEFLNEGE